MSTNALLRALSAVAVAGTLSAPCIAQVAGSFRSTGEGCPEGSLLYEQFAPGTFDLSGGPSLDWIPNGTQGFLVTRGLHQVLPTAGGTNLGLGDDFVSAPLQLNFAFPYPTGARSTSAIEVSSNGYVYLEAQTITSSRCCDGVGRVFRDFLNQTPSWAVLGMDLDPGINGTVWFNQSASAAWITWDQVPEGGSLQNFNTFQIQLHANGVVAMIWSNAAVTVHTALVGWSGGGGVPDNGPHDFSASPAFDMGPSSGPLTISAPPARLPKIGTTFLIDIRNVPSNATAGALLSGRLPASLDLRVIGMPGCFLYVTAEYPAFPLVLNPPTGSLAIPIPNVASLAGVTLETQAAMLAAGVTSIGVSSSNRGTLRVGNYDPVIVRAHGADNQNDDDSQGFWSVINATQLGIQSVRLDWLTAATANRIYFDTKQNGMADRFDGGNSTIPLCHGTYRNDSDITTALDYGVSGTTPCGGTARTGFIGTNLFSGPGEYRTIEFRFTGFDPGEVFEFDADTDGGPGNGGAMAGLAVQVRMADGSVRSGYLVRLDNDTAEVAL
ncbi:MAG: hypothetical protein IPM29_09690 [Planctomycetes bacterium]|nr:hypothetical protein [Planctomycetota bacterium]